MIELRTCSVLVVIAGMASASVALGQSTPPASDPFGTSSSGLSAGGLTPPGSATNSQSGYDPQQQDAATEQTLKTADEKDSGRGLQFIWFNAEAGFQYLSLNTFHANNLVDSQLVKSSQSGFLYGAGAGLRLVFLTLGARFRMGNFSAWQLWTLDAEAGLHMPIGRLEPHFDFAAGYAALGGFGTVGNTLNFQNAGVNIHGWNARMGFGIDIYLTRVISIGPLMTGDILYLKRSQHVTIANPTNDPMVAQAAQVYANDGSSIGGAATLTGVVGLHF
jgi:hypothetical protein